MADYSVTGMHCSSCSQIVTRTLAKVPGITDVQVNPLSETATIKFASSPIDVKILNETLGKYGYSLASYKLANQTKFSMPITTLIVSLMSLVVFILMLSQFVITMPMIPGWIMAIAATLSLFLVGRQFMLALWRFVSTGKANMDTLIGLGSITAYIYSLFALVSQKANYFDVVVVILGFITFGKYLEASTKKKTGQALEKLIQLQVKTAIVRRNNIDVEIPIEEVLKGDIVIVKPATRISVDGEVVEGASSVDESMITGEPIPAEKGIHDFVTSGTMNQNGVLIIKALNVGADTVLAQIVASVDEAQKSRAPIEHLVDRVSGIFVPSVLVIALGSGLTWLILGNPTLAITSFVGILVVACPCALGLATPSAMVVAVGRAAANGILIKDAASLEKLRSVTTVILDKTGTLTEGKPTVTDIVGPKNLLQIAASLETSSEHPLASAIVHKAEEMKIIFLKVKNFKITPGRGVVGEINSKKYYLGNSAFMQDMDVKIDETKVSSFTKIGKTPIFIAENKKLLGAIYVSDKIKATTPIAIKKLHMMGIKVVMLTGDSKNTADYIAGQLGIDNVIANVMPQAKADAVKTFKNTKEVIAMIGDGINDAPALATADVGIAMSTGTDIAISTSQITLLKGDLEKVSLAIYLARQTMKTIKYNLFWAFGYNLLLIPAAALTILNPMWASAAMAISSVTVVTNSLLLRKVKL